MNFATRFRWEARTQSLGGFVIRYQRELIPSRLAIAVSKPFYFARGRYDSPLELSLKGLLRRGRWDGFAGLLVTWNIRLFDQEAADRVGGVIHCFSGGLER